MAARAPGPDPSCIARSRPPISGAPPLIGVVTHELRADPDPAWALAAGRRERDLVPQRLSLRLTYTQAIQEAGGIAVVVPAHGFVDDTAALLDRLDGLVFSGGPDLDPAVYGHAPHPLLGPDVDRVSDEYELAMLAGAAERDLPVLAICRGMQALNVSRGGTLHQHLPDLTGLDHNQSARPFAPTHSVSVAPGSLLHRLADADVLGVNSYHHQAIDRLGAGLTVCATAPDGTVEAVWDPGARFCLGVQWHPEVLTHRADHAPLFESLVAAARPTAPALALVA
ncbi:MAG: gamma-glutamyl-gamma-aminobutyrate hydrolase family protein [Actinomycetota bacterium]|nr:gamma-glutamyl-gamma-aminobutyrate hydrolase family protein [Actinomycetota bacterium]